MLCMQVQLLVIVIAVLAFVLGLLRLVSFGWRTLVCVACLGYWFSVCACARARFACLLIACSWAYSLAGFPRSSRLPCLASLALPCLASLALLALLALLCLASPCLALLCLVLPCLALPCLALPCLALSCLALLLFWRTFFVSSLGYYVFLPTSLLSPTQSLALIPAAFCRAPFEKALRHRRRDVGALMTVAGEVRGGAVRDTTAGAARKRLRNRRCSSGFRYVVMLSFVVPGFLF